MGNPAWMICKYAMIMLQYIFGKRFYYFFKALLQSAFVIFLRHLCDFSKRLYKAPLLFFKALFSSCFNFKMCKHTISWSYFFIIFGLFLNMFQMLVLIMYKTSRFDRLFNLTMMTRTQWRFHTTTLVLCKTGVGVFESSRVAARSQLLPLSNASLRHRTSWVVAAE